MNKFLYTLLAFVVLAVSSCKDDDPDPEPEPETPSNVVELQGNLTTQTLDASKVYLLKGQVFINDGVTVTVPAGTVIKGQKTSKGTLVVGLGGKLIAEGTAIKPIVFTSDREPGARDKGDWGGIVMLGRANVNQENLPKIEGISPDVQYGTYNSTANNTENSGTLKFVRIEYAGIALSPNNETNSLTMGAIGSGTTIENVQVSFGGDDGFEWFGGVVNCKNLVSFGTWDDDFDVDFGYQGNVQYALAIRDPFAADQSASNGFEADNDGSGSTKTPQTMGVFSNVTILGPKADSNTSISGNYGYAMHLKKNTAISIFNSIFAGYHRGLLLDATNTYNNYNSGTAVLSNNIIAITKIGTALPDMIKGATITDQQAKDYWNLNNKLDTIPTGTDKVTDWPAVGIKESLFFSQNTSYPADPNLTMVTPTGSMMPTPNFAHAKLPATFFTTTTHVGAFGATDWTDGWSNFNPQSAVY